MFRISVKDKGCRIGIVRKDGTIDSIYSHFEGGPEHNGLSLYNDYQDINDINELVKSGEIATLNDYQNYKLDSIKIKNNSFRSDDDINEFIINSIDSKTDYFYMYVNDKWVFAHTSNNKNMAVVFEELKQNLEITGLIKPGIRI